MDEQTAAHEIKLKCDLPADVGKLRLKHTDPVVVYREPEQPAPLRSPKADNIV